MSVGVPTSEEFAALAARVTELEAWLAAVTTPTQSEFLTIPEAAELMRCKRQRIDDLLSAGRLERVKDGSRTLIRRTDLIAHLGEGGTHRRGRTPRPTQRSSI
jgi:excisionase family DNA binding protein